MHSQDIIFILGSGRSGSSALARVLSLCGYALPDSVFGAEQGNPRGFWEPVEAMKLNVQFLNRHGLSLGDPTRVLEDVPESEGNQYIAEIRQFLATCPPHRALVIKEPCINEVTGFWFQAARQQGFEVKVIVPIRHPQEYIASAKAFAGVPTEAAQAIWLKLNLLAERQSRDVPRAFVEYSKLVTDWRTQIARLSRTLSLRINPDAAAIDEFLTPQLHRHRSAGDIVESFGYPWISRVYSMLSGASEGEPIDVAALDEIFKGFFANARAFRAVLKMPDAPLTSQVSDTEWRPVWKAGRDF
jgi:hypothetical protein